MIRIITDSTSDLTSARVAALGIDLLPLSVHFGDEVFRDGVDITNAAFYRRLSEVETLPTTSQINPEVFEGVFRDYIAQGDQVLGIFLSSDMSGTCQSAMIAREMVDDQNIAVVDSRVVTFALGLLVEAAVLLRDKGLTLSALAEEVTTLAGRIRLLAVVDTLKYLKMGGRISSAAAVVGGLLGISPIITLENGLVESIGKARGRKAAFQWVEKRMATERPDLSLPVFFGHTDAPQAMEDCMAYFQTAVSGATLLTGEIGAVVGTHAGPGATGLAYFRAE